VNANDPTRKYYDEIGWKPVNELMREDARRSEDTRPCASAYLLESRLRFARHVPPTGQAMLDFGCGPLEDDVYRSLSKNYDLRWCVDFSETALDSARLLLRDRGRYLRADVLDVDLPENHFDCSLSSYSLYHVNETLQADVVRKLLRATRPGAPVVVIYGNPNHLATLLPGLGDLVDLMVGRRPVVEGPYYHAHPVEWWDQFREDSDVELHPLRLLDFRTQMALVPNGAPGEAALRHLGVLESTYPTHFVRWGHQYVAVLKKRPR
jgi:SAM-dependent methyltransferase